VSRRCLPRARRPSASQASTSNSALSPPRHLISSSRHRARPTPGTGSGVDGSALTRRRVVDAVGCPKSAAAAWRPQREANYAWAFGGDLESPRSGHREAGNFRYYCAELAMAKSFFEAGEDPFHRQPPRRSPGPAKQALARIGPGGPRAAAPSTAPFPPPAISCSAERQATFRQPLIDGLAIWPTRIFPHDQAAKPPGWGPRTILLICPERSQYVNTT
jgi:hypothetical protein